MKSSGLKLFRNNPVVRTGQAAYTAIADTDAQADAASYLLQGGDRVSIAVFQEPDLSIDNVEIDAGGSVNLPLIGGIIAAGRSQTEFARDIETAYASRFLRDPHVAISLVAASPRLVTVEGEVKQPGSYALRPGATLLTALAMAKSPTNTAKLDQVLIYRKLNGQNLGGRFDLQAIRSGKAIDPQMIAGDIVVVGYSRSAGAWNDILRAAPLFNTFVLLDGNKN